MAQNEESAAAWYRDLVEFSPEAAFVVVDGRFVYVNPAAVRLFGAPGADALVGTDVLLCVHPDDHSLALARRKRVLELNEPAPIVEMRFVAQDSRVFEVEVQATAIDFGGRRATYAAARDISARRRLEEQMRQSQKLEAVGRLAGGVAHDFNNTLAIILGHVEFLLSDLDAAHPLRRDVEAIQRAAQHSSALTRQLLTYARRQSIAPRALDLNTAVAETLTMLAPLLGEHIELQWLPGKRLGAVTLDPAQLDQILTNLCTNARDAIDGVGTLTIATANRSLDATAATSIAEAVPGDYVVLTITDTGRGMAPEVIGRAFEPFFTTKPLGKGTGLGLATVYGIVRQNQGCITLRSVEGVGSRVEIYFPRRENTITPEEPGPPVIVLPKGTETVLIVEDEADILHLTARALRAQGYTVLTAPGPEEALGILSAHTSPIHLLLSDVMMPVMSGPDLARQVTKVRTDIRVLFMSGFSADLITKQGQLDPDVNFIGKPFTLSELTTRVREALDGRSAAA